jgi:hypothetical protein
MRYNVVMKEVDKATGKILSVSKGHNLVVTTGLDRCGQLLAGLSSNSMTHIAIGTDNTAVNAGQTALVTEVERESATRTSEGSQQYKWAHTFSVGSGTSYSIQEAGLFDAGSGGTMLNRYVQSLAKTLDVNTNLIVEVTITFSAV